MVMLSDDNFFDINTFIGNQSLLVLKNDYLNEAEIMSDEYFFSILNIMYWIMM